MLDIHLCNFHITICQYTIIIVLPISDRWQDKARCTYLKDNQIYLGFDKFLEKVIHIALPCYVTCQVWLDNVVILTGRILSWCTKDREENHLHFHDFENYDSFITRTSDEAVIISKINLVWSWTKVIIITKPSSM